MWYAIISRYELQKNYFGVGMVFESFIKKEKEALYIGAPEAEAESLPTSKVSLKDVYVDYHNLYEELSNEKYILLGRKGCGKSAFAEFSYLSSLDDANLFCSFISQDNITLEKLVQLGKENEIEHTKDHLFKWLIYTNIIKMFFENEAAQQAGGYKLLKEFIKKNNGYIDINTGEIVELVKKHSFEINIEQFKRFFRGRFNKDVQIKESRAAFYKLLPHLEEVVVDVLTNNLNVVNANSYVLFFDDLDIDFHANEQSSVETLIQLIRTTKHVNNSVFAKNNAKAKVIVLIRDDIERILCSKAADISKLFSSYSAHLDWYEEQYNSTNDEDSLALKKMINKRIKNAYKLANLNLDNHGKPWETLIKDDFSPKTSFKYICDHTMFRPRDLILVFKPLESGKYKLPLDKWNINNLLGQYSAELVKELSNELSSYYSDMQIQNIFDALKKINNKYDCTYNEAIAFLDEYVDRVPSNQILQDLYNRSIIGGVDRVSRHVHFKHKSTRKEAHEYKIDLNDYMIVHAGVAVNLKNR